MLLRARSDLPPTPTAAAAPGGGSAAAAPVPGTALKQQQHKEGTGTTARKNRQQHNGTATTARKHRQQQQEGNSNAIATSTTKEVAVANAISAAAGLQVLVVAALDDERVAVADAAKTVAALRKVQSLRQEADQVIRLQQSQGGLRLSGEMLHEDRESLTDATAVSQAATAGDGSSARGGSAAAAYDELDCAAVGDGSGSGSNRGIAGGDGAAAAAIQGEIDGAAANGGCGGANSEVAEGGGVLLRVVRGGHNALVGNNQESAIQMAFLIGGVMRAAAHQKGQGQPGAIELSSEEAIHELSRVIASGPGTLT
jgi:hypothetical protein